jgi:predicted phosphodiesterase
MRLLVISDVHADARALEAVLEDADRRGWDRALFLGDAVGYGDEPGAALALLRSLDMQAGVSGNHEAMLAELREGRMRGISGAVTASLADNLRQLAPDDLGFLDRLEQLHLADDWGAVHGAPRERFEYLISVPVARANAGHMERDLYFVGHTHVPGAYLETPDGDWQVRGFTTNEGTVRIPRGARAFLNPGAISLPRDTIPGSSYGIYDDETREFTVFRRAGRTGAGTGNR